MSSAVDTNGREPMDHQLKTILYGLFKTFLLFYLPLLGRFVIVVSSINVQASFINGQTYLLTYLLIYFSMLL